jgi:glutathione S-transferase
MQLIGMLDSPFVRRAAISARLLELPFEHESVSVFRQFDHFKTINPVVKAPTLLLDDGTMLIDSSLILDYFDQRVAPEKRLMPEALAPRVRVLELTGLALAAMEKTVQAVYESALRPEDKQYQPWLARVLDQLDCAYRELEERLAQSDGQPWLVGARLTQADVTVAVAWRFTQFMQADYPVLKPVDLARFPALARLSARMEALPAFVATPIDG